MVFERRCTTITFGPNVNVQKRREESTQTGVIKWIVEFLDFSLDNIAVINIPATSVALFLMRHGVL